MQLKYFHWLNSDWLISTSQLNTLVFTIIQGTDREISGPMRAYIFHKEGSILPWTSRFVDWISRGPMQWKVSGLAAIGKEINRAILEFFFSKKFIDFLQVYEKMQWSEP